MFETLFNKKALLFTATMMMSSASALAQEALFYEKDFSDTSTKVAQYGAGTVSNKLGVLPNGNVTFLVYGGNENLQGIVRKVAERLQGKGIHIGYIKAGVSHSQDWIMDVELYTLGGTKFNSTLIDNDKLSLEEKEQQLYDHAIKAYEDEFGKLAKVKSEPVYAQR